MSLGSPEIQLLPSQIQPYSPLCVGDPTCVLILFNFAGQGLLFSGKEKGSPESGRV